MTISLHNVSQVQAC